MAKDRTGEAPKTEAEGYILFPVEINPQPLPPGEVAINPQPLPPHLVVTDPLQDGHI